MSNSSQNPNTSNIFKYSAEDDLYLENSEQQTNCQGMNERDSQPIRFPDTDFLESSSDDGEPSRVTVRQINANAILSNSSTGTRVHISDGNCAALQPQTAVWNNDSNVTVYYSSSQPFAIPPTLENNSQHISLLSSSCHHSDITTNNNFSRSSSDPSSNHSINVSNTLRMAAADLTISHNGTLAENGVENSDKFSPELDSQISVDGINSKFSTYSASQGDASSSGRLISSQGEDVNSKNTSLVRRGVKRKLSTSQNIQEGQTEVADEDDKKEKLREKNREYAQQSRKRKNEKMESLEQENNKKDVIIEIYTKLLTIYHKELHKGTDPSWIKTKKTWYPSGAASRDNPLEIELKLPVLGDDFYRKLGNALCGEIIHDTSKSIKREEISESFDQDRQIGTQNVPTYYEDNGDTHEDVQYVKTTNSDTERGFQVNPFPNTSCSLQRAQTTASASYAHSGTENKPVQTKITQFTQSCKPSDSGLPTSPKSRHYVQNSPHAAPKLNHARKLSLIKVPIENGLKYININQVRTFVVPNSVVAGQLVIAGQHDSTLSAVQSSSTFPISKNTEKSHITAGNNSHNLGEATSHVMTMSAAEAKVVRDTVVSFREQGVGYQALRLAADANNVEDLEPSIEIC